MGMTTGLNGQSSLLADLGMKPVSVLAPKGVNNKQSGLSTIYLIPIPSFPYRQRPRGQTNWPLPNRVQHGFPPRSARRWGFGDEGWKVSYGGENSFATSCRGRPSEKIPAVYRESGLVKSALLTSAADISVFILNWQVFHRFPPNCLP